MFGTVDCYVLWRLTGGKVHATDATKRSRTLLFNIHSGKWDDDLLKILRVPRSCCRGEGFFGKTLARAWGRTCSAAALRSPASPATAGRHHWPGLFLAGMIQVDLWHRLFCLLNHRHHRRLPRNNSCSPPSPIS